jgi:hypothetical protein
MEWRKKKSSKHEEKLKPRSEGEKNEEDGGEVPVNCGAGM